ncbi:MAG: type domain protein [Sediminibacterium sp.]|nr:type domain protein [Sediminibacterium sp.]
MPFLAGMLAFCYIACTKTTDPNPVPPTSEVPAVKTAFIEFFLPQTGADGDEIHIKGKNFTGTTTVSFAGKAAQSFSVISDSVIYATIASGTVSGKLSVTTPVNTAEATGFTYYSPQVVKLSGHTVYGTMMNNLLPQPKYDSSKYKETTVQETASLSIRMINPNDLARNYTLSAILGKLYLPSYVDSSTYVIFSGVEGDDAGKYDGYTVAHYLPRFSNTAVPIGTVFARIINNAIYIPLQYPYTGISNTGNGYISIQGSGTINGNTISLNLFCDDRHGNTKRSTLQSIP